MTSEQLEIVGWRYEVYSETLDTRTPVTTFTRTAPKIRERVSRLRRLIPLVADNAVIAATRQPDDATATDRSEHTIEASARRTRTVAAARDRHESDHNDTNPQVTPNER